jgi:drug/metabolite transporter (DMT)-like permease
MLRNTSIGLIAVLVWGGLLPLGRVAQDQIGPLTYTGLIFLGVGLLTLAKRRFKVSVSSRVWKHPALYLRWLCFVFHEGTVALVIGFVSIEHIPIVLLINYLWPTAILVCSVLIAGVKIHRPFQFSLGSTLVVVSLAIEFLGGQNLESYQRFTFQEMFSFSAVFLGAIAWGLYSALSRRFGDESGGVQVIPLFQLTLGGLFFLSFLPQFSHPWMLDSYGATIIVMSIVSNMIAYLAWDFGVRFGSIVVLSLAADFIPWMSLATASLVLGTPLTTRTIVSALLLVFGAVLTRIGTMPSILKNKSGRQKS